MFNRERVAGYSPQDIVPTRNDSVRSGCCRVFAAYTDGGSGGMSCCCGGGGVNFEERVCWCETAGGFSGS